MIQIFEQDKTCFFDGLIQKLCQAKHGRIYRGSAWVNKFFPISLLLFKDKEVCVER